MPAFFPQVGDDRSQLAPANGHLENKPISWRRCTPLRELTTFSMHNTITLLNFSGERDRI